MIAELLGQITTALATFTSETRLYGLSIAGQADDLMVEAFVADDALSGIGGRDVIAVSTSAHLALDSLLGQSATLAVSLANGSRTEFAGDISEAAMLGSEGGLARYRLRLSPWVWRLGQVRNSRVWEEKSVIDIVDSVLAGYGAVAQWRWSDEVGPFMEHASLRSYCCQYRETDLDFVLRLLAEEGLAWRFEQSGDGPAMVLFADSSDAAAVPQDASSGADGGIRFHGARAREAQDTVQALQARRAVAVSMSSVLSYDYKAKKAISASAPSRLDSGRRLPPLESYDVPGQYAYASGAQAQRYADMQMQAREARSQAWRGRSTVRTLRAGTRLDVIGSPLQVEGVAAYTVLRVLSVGVNNLPSPAQHALAELFGPIPELLEDQLHAAVDKGGDFALALAEARKSGYANVFEAVENSVIWRPMLAGSDGRSHPRPTAGGAQSAIVIGADGASSAGADELYCDRLGRVRIRFHWQQGDAACWVRVAQRAAGGGMGSQFLPRIGQEVLVQFLENDIDRPLIVGALYNGQGEGGIAPTPGGASDSAAGADLFAKARDHATSAQGNLAGGNSPLWHGASGAAPGHRNGAAQWGVRSKEFGGGGYSQLLFDDTDAQGRIQLRSTHAASELNLGHLIHQADNYRGSLRGHGAELRTDAYGAVRAGAGLLVSSYKLSHAFDARDPAGDNAPGIALLKQAVKLGESFSGAAVKHATVGFGTHLGGGKAGSSVLNDTEAPLKAMLTAVSGMVADATLDDATADAGKRATSPAKDKLPHSADPLIAISARAGLGVSAGQSLQLSNGEAIALMSGQDTQFVTGGQLRVHAGQALGVLGGAVKPGEGGIGLQLIAAKDAVDVQAQADTLKVQARDDVRIVSANAQVDWAAAKQISLSTAAGANITISGGNITVQCPGKLTIHAGKKSFSGPATMGADMPVLPSGTLKFDEKFQLLDPAGDPVKDMRYVILKEGGGRIEGITDGEGMIPLQQGFSPENLKIQILGKVKS